MSRQDALLAWFQLFPELELSIPSFTSLKNGVAVSSVYSYLSGQKSPPESSASSSPAWFIAFKRIRDVSTKLMEFLQNPLRCDATAIARREDSAEIEKLVAMLISYALKSPKANDVKVRMQSLAPETSAEIESLLSSGEEPAKATISTSRSESPEESDSPRATSDTSLLNTLRLDISALKKTNNALKAELAEQKDDAVTDQQLAEANASIFPLEVVNQTKLSKIQQLADIETHVETLRRQRDELLSVVARLEHSTTSGTEADYSVLIERLQELKVDPATQEVERLCAEKKDFKRRIRKLKLQTQALQAKAEGHQDPAVLTARRDFLARLVEVNRMKKARAQVNMRILQKKMRQETFQLEMRSFL
jgi:hypothetical protein